MELSPISNLFVAKTVSGPYLSPKGDFKHENMIECPARLNSLTGGKNRCKPVKTVSGPYLSSPDELESTCMRFRKRRSSLITCEMHSTHPRSGNIECNGFLPRGDDMRAHRSWEPSSPFCSLSFKSATGYPESQNLTVHLSMFEWGVVVVRILTAMVELVP